VGVRVGSVVVGITVGSVVGAKVVGKVVGLFVLGIIVGMLVVGALVITVGMMVGLGLLVGEIVGRAAVQNSDSAPPKLLCQRKEFQKKLVKNGCIRYKQ